MVKMCAFPGYPNHEKSTNLYTINNTYFLYGS